MIAVTNNTAQESFIRLRLHCARRVLLYHSSYIINRSLEVFCYDHEHHRRDGITIEMLSELEEVTEKIRDCQQLACSLHATFIQATPETFVIVD